MRITDYESTKSLTDVGLTLTREEAEELYAYLHRMLEPGKLNRAFLTETDGRVIERELTVTVEHGRCPLQLSA